MQDQLDEFTSLIRTSPEGILFSGSAPYNWEEISLFQYYRRNPIHMHFRAGLEGRGTRVWQYHPTNGNGEGQTKSRYVVGRIVALHNELTHSWIRIVGW